MAKSKTLTSPTSPLSLPPQTTPFFYDGPGCEQSIYCAGMTSMIYPSTRGGQGGGPCFGVHAVTSIGFLINPASQTTQTYMGYNNFCFPEYYYDLFGDQRQQAIWGWPHGTQEGDRSTLAYPGTACPWRWTTVCTTTLTHKGLNSPQAWCCPPGGWDCAATLGGDSADPQRLCKSILTTTTDVWMSFDPAFTMAPHHEEYTWHVPVGGGSSLQVYHKVFPLLLTASVEERHELVTASAETTRAALVMATYQAATADGASVLSSRGKPMTAVVILAITTMTSVVALLAFVIRYLHRQQR